MIIKSIHVNTLNFKKNIFSQGKKKVVRRTSLFYIFANLCLAQ